MMLTYQTSKHIIINIFICELFTPLCGGVYARANFACGWRDLPVCESYLHLKRHLAQNIPYIFGILTKKNFIWEQTYTQLSLIPMMPNSIFLNQAKLVVGKLHAFSMSVNMGTCFEACGSIPILFMWIFGMESTFLHICQEPRHPNRDKACG